MPRARRRTFTNADKRRILQAADLCTKPGEVDLLRALIAEAAHVPKSRRATKPTRGSQRRRVEGKVQRGQVKAMRGKVGGGD